MLSAVCQLYLNKTIRKRIYVYVCTHTHIHSYQVSVLNTVFFILQNGFISMCWLQNNIKKNKSYLPIDFQYKIGVNCHWEQFFLHKLQVKVRKHDQPGVC